ncbi:hypothetical protein HY02_03770 [Peptococcaceae bacterium SCADC1_2_3]|jgi:hypothetical protein|nr:hypothetical protein DK28_0207210 [Peptococcaceae bacterium SCADC1_2_3]KFI38271.1 hypothetical protein HY02_03770 [Peptococcaceae bacterium SCADC1_2_3]
MRWQDVRLNYPSKWLVIEAFSARTENKKRIIEGIKVVDTFEDGNSALRKYLQLHKEHPEKEMYVVHTSRPELEVEELIWTGVRAAR